MQNTFRRKGGGVRVVKMLYVNDAPTIFPRKHSIAYTLRDHFRNHIYMNEDDTRHLIERHLLNATTHRMQQLIEGQVIGSKTHRRNLSTTEKSWMMTTRRYKLMFGFSGYCLHFIFSHDMAEGGSDFTSIPSQRNENNIFTFNLFFH